MRATKNQIIGKNTYEVTQFGAKRGREVLFTLTTMLGPAAGGMLKGGLSEAGISEALQAFANTAKPQDFNALCDAFADCTSVLVTTQGVTPAQIKLELSKVFDDHFAGNYGEMLGWLAFAIQVNFASFFPETGTGSGLLDLLGVTKKSD